jgi:mannose/fructose/N-acetylgalactosamine-specific phosphotransferase system component IIC
MQIIGILLTLIGFAVVLLYLLSKEKNLTGKDQ